MPQLGLTVLAGNKLLDTFSGVASVAPVICLQLHDDFPAIDGTGNVFAGAVRSSATYAPAANCVKQLTADLPSFTITAPTDSGKPIAYVSAWTGFENDPNAYCFALGRILAPQTLAAGDTVKFATCPIAFISTVTS